MKPIEKPSVDQPSSSRALPPIKQKKEAAADEQSASNKLVENLLQTELTLDVKGSTTYNSNDAMFFWSDAQIFVAAGAENEVKITAQGQAVQLFVYKPDMQFPMKRETELYAKSSRADSAELVVKSRGIDGFVVFVCGMGQVSVHLDGLGKPIVSVISLQQ